MVDGDDLAVTMIWRWMVETYLEGLAKPRLAHIFRSVPPYLLLSGRRACEALAMHPKAHALWTRKRWYA